MPQQAGRRYPLLIYSYMLNRWWPATLTLSIGLFGLAWALSRTWQGQANPWAVTVAAALGGFVLVVTVFLFAIRKAAYVQPFETYLRLVTPFLRFNIAYKRFRGTITAEMGVLFPPKSLPNWRREIVAPIAGKTALVINLNGYPVAPQLLRLFLSPFFFKDKTPHLVILVESWLQFSTELDSRRVGGKKKIPPTRKDDSILSRLPKL